jgi:putative FmdB family regulatory protein
MPLYEYECTNCKFYVEALQKITDEPLKQCPSCKKKTLKKLVSAPHFRLKGSGWYETDFKSDKEEKRNLADREEPTESKSDSETKTKTKTKSSAASKKPASAKTPARAAAAKSKAKPAAKKTASKPAAKKKAKKAGRR